VFRVREQLVEGIGGPLANAAALSHAQMLTQMPAQISDEPVVRAKPSLDPYRRWTLIDRLADCKAVIEYRCHGVNLVADLADGIGSKHWLRGIGTFIGLSVAAISFWPDFTSLEAATSMPFDNATRDEFRSQMIMPLALGSDSGRRMGASVAVLPLANVPERQRIEFVATLGQGDSFGRMLQRSGVGAGDAARVSDMIAARVPLGNIAAGTRFAVTLGQRSEPGQPRPLDRLDFRARFDLNLVVEKHGRALAIENHPIAVDTTPLRIRGTVGSGLYRSARAAGAPVMAIQQYLQALDSHISLEGDIAPSDTFDIIVAHKRAASGESETGELLFAGIERAGKPRAQLLRWGKEGQFFEASAMGAMSQASVSQASGGMFAPVNGHMTSGYGLRRHPILGYTRMHAGIDFGAAWGSPIFAVNDGTVSYVGRHGGHGNYVRLEHGGGLATGYAHMSRFAVSPGAHVRAGQVIGYVGSTGLSTGPHLHYELYQNGRTVNPMAVRFTVTTQIVDKTEQDAFKARLAQLKGVVPGTIPGGQKSASGRRATRLALNTRD
jgi:murein DD-endopeptidase MepM/ murein hydrolase activator NlpD